jgi:hypothetical protein
LLLIAIPFVSALLGGLLATIFSYLQHKKERWWEHKTETYTQVISALHDARLFSDENYTASTTRRDIAPERDAELRAKSKSARDTILKARDTGIFFLSDEAIKRIEQYEKEQSQATHTTSWEEYLDSDLAATSSCLNDFIKIAKKDLGKITS